MAIPARVESALPSCPAWVRWLAQDRDGTWWGYEVQPLPHDTGWYENEVGRSIKLAHTAPNPDWEQTLQAYTPEG